MDKIKAGAILFLLMFALSACALFFPLPYSIAVLTGEFKGADAKKELNMDLDTARQTFLQIAKIEGMKITVDQDIRETLRVPKEKEPESADDWRTEKGMEEPKKVIWGEVIGKKLWAVDKDPKRIIRIKMMKTEDNKVGIGVWANRYGIGAAATDILIAGRWGTRDKKYASHVLELLVSGEL